MLARLASRSPFNGPRLRVGAAALLLSLAAAGLARTEPTAPRIEDSATVLDVNKLLSAAHLTGRKLDDAASRRIYKNFLKSLDPMKLYFSASDIAEFAAQETALDDKLRVGDLKFAYLVFKRYLERVATRVEWAVAAANAPFDPAAEEEVTVDGEAAVWAPDEEAARARWQTYVHYQIAGLVADGTAEADARKRLEKRYRTLAKDLPQTGDDELVELYLNAMTMAYDPHTSYMGPRTLEDFRISIELSLEGIGALLAQEDGITVVREVIPGGAAALDGRLKAGDRIVAVGQGEHEDLVDVVEMRQRDVVRKIRGKAGTLVRLEVMPAGATGRVVYALTRRKVELKEQAARGEIVEIAAAPGGGAALKVGVITLPSFYADAAANRPGGEGEASATHDMRRLLDGWKAQKLDGVIVDLRTNGGGLLPESIGVTGLFIDQGPVVQVKGREGKVTVYPDTDAGTAWDGPLVLVISRFSASASEIFAGAIQDYGRGLIVGDARTHGKGTVQRILNLSALVGGVENDSSLGALKLTVEQFYRPSGDSTQARGVLSDVALPAWTDDDRYGESRSEGALAFDRIARAEFAGTGNLTTEEVKRLAAASRARFAARPELVADAQQTEAARARLERKSVRFTVASLQAERKALAAEQGEEADGPAAGAGAAGGGAAAGASGGGKEGEPAAAKKKPFGSIPYTREVLEIAADYIRAAKK
ncbi:MAG: carboxy terminal-processing peptidase [Planctomycetes bacterium]|nr:carboxy terminal-processing peptidase [Planctomycetota bacterium]